jgi:hypothetical protein
MANYWFAAVHVTLERASLAHRAVDYDALPPLSQANP